MSAPRLSFIRLVCAIPIAFVAGITIIFASTLLGIEVLSILESKYCPDGPYGGNCAAPSWRTHSIQIYLALIAGLAAAGTVLVASALAQSHKRIIRILVLIIGLILAAFIASEDSAFLVSSITATLSGIVAIWVLERRTTPDGKRSGNAS